MWRLLSMQIKFTAAVIVGIVVQLLLVVIAVLAIVPGITRDLAGWVQRKLSATLGDSFLFVTSPITGAAVFSRVKKDLDWLSARCDRVIVLAHSQGAAVSYRVIERQFWDGHAPQKIESLVTYGSGLRKLFDLETIVKHRRFWTVLSIWSGVMALLTAGLIALPLSGVIPWWIALPGLFVGVVFLQIGPLVSAKQVLQDPVVLPIPWHDYYSSHDPVPNGPIDVVSREVAVWFQEMGIRPFASARGAADDSDVVEFTSRQREVVNRRSTLSDHTGYWSSLDDFVGRVAGLLADASNMPLRLTLDPIRLSLDEEWQKISRDRRLWRVTWLSRCRTVASLACLSILLWPRSALEPAASQVRELMVAAAANLPEKLGAWAPTAAFVQDWLLGAGGLVLATYVMFLVASANWSLWEKRELTWFFNREPHSSIGIAGWVFALGWLGVLVLAPAYALAHAHSNWGGILAVLWAPLILAAWSAWMVHKAGRGPGTPLEWGRIPLARAEKIIAGTEGDRTESLRQAKFCFMASKKYLEKKHSGSDEWVRAVLGEARATEELAQSNLAIRIGAPETYREAIEALKRAGRDASEVQSWLDKAASAQVKSF